MSTCTDIEAELVAYHFGLVDDETRARVEAHLLGCRACLAAFLETKRAVEIGEDSPAPSPTARARIRRDVARELGIEDASSARKRWERPVAFAFAAAAVFVLMGATQALTSRSAAPYAVSHGMPR